MNQMDGLWSGSGSRREYPQESQLHANENISRACLEGRTRDDLPANVHEGMNKLIQIWRRSWQCDDEGLAFELLAGQVEESDDTEEKMSEKNYSKYWVPTSLSNLAAEHIGHRCTTFSVFREEKE